MGQRELAGHWRKRFYGSGLNATEDGVVDDCMSPTPHLTASPAECRRAAMPSLELLRSWALQTLSTVRQPPTMNSGRTTTAAG